MSAGRWYRGWYITRTDSGAWWVATNYAGGYGRVMADTLDGIRRVISDAISAGAR